ncbi:MAG: hypothetical protein RL557_866 [archaeon]|jgi:hypothetical protein
MISQENFAYKKLLYLVGIFFILGVSALTVDQIVSVNVVPGKIDVFSPVPGIYDSRMIRINISFSDNAIFRIAKYSDNGDSFVTLCRDCFEYGYDNPKIKPFDDGFHRVRLLGIFEAGEVESIVEFFVDSKKPIIHKTLPKEGFGDGSFSIEFSEENPRQLVLYYGNEQSLQNKEVDLDSCQSKFYKRKVCDVSADLGAFDEQEIEYWFELIDIANHSDTSSKKKLKVDFSEPVVNNFIYFITGKKVHFFFDISESNFKEINFIDRNSFFPRWQTLCSNLQEGICEKTRGFLSGDHRLDIEVVDTAGNKNLIEGIEFSID